MEQYRSGVRLFVGLLSLLPLAPAHLGSGDSVQPRNTESVIEKISPSVPDGVKIEIVGGDTFIRLTAVGVRAEVRGYDEEPYLRINEDGRVEINDASVTAVLNGDRYGNVDTSQMKPGAVPQWRTISVNGIAMWHDHRSHWMSPMKPATIDDKGTVLKWDIPMTIAGKATVVSGTLYLREAASVAWWLLIIPAVAIAVLLSLLRRRSFFALIVGTSLLGVLTGFLEFTGLPEDAQITPVMLMFCAGAAVLAIVASVRLIRPGAMHIAVSLNAGAGAALIVGAWLTADQVRAAYIPGIDAMWLARAAIPVMMGVGLVSVIDGVTRIVRTAP
jgi:hypothetical protein